MNRFIVLICLTLVFAIPAAFAISCTNSDADGYNISSSSCGGYSSCFNFTSISFENIGNLTYVRLNLTVDCSNEYSYFAISLPSGVTALSPANGATYTSPLGRKYSVENPTNNPFYSIKFSLSNNNGIVYKNGASDMFVFTLNSSKANYTVLRLQAHAGQSTGDYNQTTPAMCLIGCGTNDCNDSNSNVYPGATEICNNIDDDCDSLIDEGNVCVLVCEPQTELIANGGFELPVVNTTAKWNIFPSGTPSLAWNVLWQSNQTTYGGKTRPTIANIELQRGVNGWLPAEGSQWAELDGDWFGPNVSLDGEPSSVKIYQDIATIPGATYSISFKFSPRPSTNSSENILEVKVDNTVLATLSKAGSSNTNWTYYTYNFTATNNITRIQFTDLGIPDSLGTFLDNVSLKCTFAEPLRIHNCSVSPRDFELPNSTYISAFVTPVGQVTEVKAEVTGPASQVIPLNIVSGSNYSDYYTPVIDGNYSVVIFAKDSRNNTANLSCGTLSSHEPLFPPPIVHCEGIYSLGIAAQPSILDSEKAKAFLNLNYYCARNLLGLWNYDFYFEVKHLNGSYVNIDGRDVKYGKYPPPDATIFVLNRPALLRSGSLTYEQVMVTIGVWI